MHFLRPVLFWLLLLPLWLGVPCALQQVSSQVRIFVYSGCLIRSLGRWLIHLGRLTQSSEVKAVGGFSVVEVGAQLVWVGADFGAAVEVGVMATHPNLYFKRCGYLVILEKRVSFIVCYLP